MAFIGDIQQSPLTMLEVANILVRAGETKMSRQRI